MSLTPLKFVVKYEPPLIGKPLSQVSFIEKTKKIKRSISITYWLTASSTFKTLTKSPNNFSKNTQNIWKNPLSASNKYFPQLGPKLGLKNPGILHWDGWQWEQLKYGTPRKRIVNALITIWITDCRRLRSRRNSRLLQRIRYRNRGYGGDRARKQSLPK